MRKIIYTILIFILFTSTLVIALRIEEGDVAQKVAFVAVAADQRTAVTGLSDITVMYSVGGGACVEMTTPTITEMNDVNMPGDYWLYIDESGMVTLPANTYEAELFLHLSAPNMIDQRVSVEIFHQMADEVNALFVAYNLHLAYQKLIDANGVQQTEQDATQAAIATAQSDLDILTGTDGATLATSQPNYTPAVAGDAMTLADDAITSAKFDESTAHPLKSADTGSTKVARTGEDSDTLETLSDEIAAVKSDTTAILIDTSAQDTDSERRTSLFGSNITGATGTQATTIDGHIITLISMVDDSNTSQTAQHSATLAAVQAIDTNLATITTDLIATAVWAKAITDYNDPNYIGGALIYMLELAQADQIINTAYAPWRKQWLNPADGNEIYQQKELFDIEGDDITAISTYIGQEREP